MRGSVQLGLLKGTRTLSTDVFNSIQVTFLVRCVQFNKKKRNGQSIKTDLSLEKEYGLQLLYVFNNFETRSFRFLRRKVELFYKLSQGLLVPLIWICQQYSWVNGKRHTQTRKKELKAASTTTQCSKRLTAMFTCSPSSGALTRELAGKWNPEDVRVLTCSKEHFSENSLSAFPFTRVMQLNVISPAADYLRPLPLLLVTHEDATR